MEIADWITDRFGSTNTSTLLDESVYSTDELQSDKHQLERKLSQLESELDDHATRYRHFLHKGAEADEMKRSQFAQKARFEKKKYEVTKKKYKQVSIKLGTVISIEGMREITSMQEQTEFNIDDHVGADMETADIQTQVMDQMAEFGLNMEDMQAVQEALDVEILDKKLEMEASEEMELMEQMEADKVTKEQIDIESETDGAVTEAQPDDLEEGTDFDIDADLDEDELDLDSL